MNLKHYAIISTLLILLGIGIAGSMAQDDGSVTIALSHNDELGSFLVDGNGMTLYIFTNDEAGISNCNGDCAASWPPVLIADTEMPTNEGVPGMLNVIERTDGSRQVIYNGNPLYYWIEDAAPGDTNGHTLGDVWFAASTPTIGLSKNSELGSFLVDSQSMTLYIFTDDEAGVSNCNDDCATSWPPYTVENEDVLKSQHGLAGEYDVIERNDGSLQVTYNEMPLYYWVEDTAPGDTNGHTLGDVWFIAKPATLSIAENEALGEILVSDNGLTLYTFTNDGSGISNCNDDCAIGWPPLTIVEDEAVFGGQGVDGEVAFIERADGSLQVTYNGSPLYYWFEDVVPGDTNGHNVGDVWFAAQP